MAIEQNLAQLSNVLVYSAMAVYTGAFGAFVADLGARGARAGLESARQEARQLATVGGPAAGTGAEITIDAPAAEPAAPRRRALGIAMSLTWLAFGLHLAAVITRGLSAQRAPWGNMFEFATTGSMVVTAVFLLVLWKRDLHYLGTFVIGPVLLTLGLAVSVLYTEAAQLVPALRSYWLLIHVSVAFVASALFTLGFSTSVLQLLQERRERARAAGNASPRGRFMDALPGSVDLERSSYQLHIAAFPLWGFTLIAGGIWAEAAWGHYWNWDPKEVWTFIIWVVYAAYLHARATRGWEGRRAAYLVMFGYACLLANFLVVNFFAVGKHTYAR
ncbi:MAG: c-type cytochrome biogenesis protein CcsB [Kineosporiaceae bacterium]